MRVIPTLRQSCSRWAIVAALVFGCSPQFYHRQADRDTYAIIRAKQQQVTGQAGPFDITPPVSFEEELRRRNLAAATRPDGATLSRGRLVLVAAGRSRPAELPVGQLVDVSSPATSQPETPYATTTQQEEAASTIPPITGPAELFIEPGRWPAGVQRIDLLTALRLAAMTSRQFQAGKETVYRSALALTGEQYAFESQFFGTIDGSLDQTAKDTRSGTVTSEVGFNRTFLTGGTMAASLTNTLFEVFTDPTGKAAASAANLTLSQPLLRGAGYRVTVEPLLQADRDTTYAVRTFERLKRELAVTVARQFYQVVQQGDQVVNERNNYVNLIVARQRADKLCEAGRLPGFQADQAHQDELRARNRWVAAIQRYNQSVDDFRQQIGLPTDWAVVPDPDSLARLLRDGLNEALPTPDEATRTAVANRLDLKTAADRVDDAARGIYVAADALKMGLTVSASAEVPTTPGLNRPAQFRVDHGVYSLGALVDLPLDRRLERNAYRAAQIDLAAAQRALTDQFDTVTGEVREQLRNVAAARNGYDIQRPAMELARRRVASTNMLLAAGRAETRDLLEAQAALVEAQNALTGAMVQYHIARLELLRAMDVLQVEPAGLTYHDANDTSRR